MDRRQFLQGSAVGLGVLSLGPKGAVAASKDKRAPDAVVIGAGVFGVWTAYTLLKRGLSVTLVDAFGAGNVNSGSGGPTRMVQTDTDTTAYIRSTIAAFPKWKQAEELSGQRFLYEIGRLRLELDDKHLQRAKERQANQRQFGIDNTEIMDGAEVRKRWPQIRGDDVVFASFNGGGPGGSTLLASKACKAIADLFVKSGGTLVIGEAVPVVSKQGTLDGIRLASGQQISGGKYVFVCGWKLPQLFSDLLGERIIVEGRDVFYYDVGRDNQRYAYQNMPAWSVPAENVYGFPAIDGEGLKVAPSYDPSKSSDLAADMRKFTDGRFPGMKDSALKIVRKCWVDLTIDYDFLVDEHPAWTNAYLVGGGSGHGFKHGPNIGEDAARLVLGEQRDEELATLFKLDERKFDLSKKKRFDDK